MADFSYQIVDGFDKVIEEKGNQVLALRKIKWGDKEQVHLDLRKWISTDDGERCGKGTSFFTEDEGPAELINVLIDEGYGDTKVILNHVSKRNDFNDSIINILGDSITEDQIKRFKELNFKKEPYDDSEELYDPKTELFDE